MLLVAAFSIQRSFCDIFIPHYLCCPWMHSVVVEPILFPNGFANIPWNTYMDWIREKRTCDNAYQMTYDGLNNLRWWTSVRLLCAKENESAMQNSWENVQQQQQQQRNKRCLQIRCCDFYSCWICFLIFDLFCCCKYASVSLLQYNNTLDTHPHILTYLWTHKSNCNYFTKWKNWTNWCVCCAHALTMSFDAQICSCIFISLVFFVYLMLRKNRQTYFDLMEWRMTPWRCAVRWMCGNCMCVCICVCEFARSKKKQVVSFARSNRMIAEMNASLNIWTK